MWILLTCLTYSFYIVGMEPCWSIEHKKTIHDALYSPYSSDKNTSSTEEELSSTTSSNEYTVLISTSLPELFLPDSSVVKLVDRFLSSYELNSLNTNSIPSFIDCFTNKKIQSFIKTLKANIQNEIAALINTPTTKNIPTMLTMQEHLEKIKLVDYIPIKLIDVLMHWPSIPTQHYASLLSLIWYTYILHLIPNTKLRIAMEKVTTYFILDNYESLESYIKQLNRNTNDFIYIFECQINCEWYITQYIIPSLNQYIKDQKKITCKLFSKNQNALNSKEADSEINQRYKIDTDKEHSIKPFKTVLLALKKLLSILSDPNYKISELESIDHLRASWYCFWNNEDLEKNAESVTTAINELLHQGAECKEIIINRLKNRIDKDLWKWDSIWPHESTESYIYHDGVIKSLDA